MLAAYSFSVFSKNPKQNILRTETQDVSWTHLSHSSQIHLSFVLFCLFVFVVVVFVFRDRVSLYSPGCPGTHFVEQAGLKLRNLPASASQVLGLKACKDFFFLIKPKPGECWHFI